MRISKDDYSSRGDSGDFKLLSLLPTFLMISLVLSAEVMAASKKVNLGPGGVRALNELGCSVSAVNDEVINKPTQPSGGSTWKGEYIYFGRNVYSTGFNPIKWRVLHPKGYANVSNNFSACITVPDSILLFADQEFFKPSEVIPLSSCYTGSPKKMMNEVADKFNQQFLEEDKYFSAEEQSSIMVSSGGVEKVTEKKVGSVVEWELWNPDIGGRQVFLLSAAEITNASYGFPSTLGSSLSEARYAPLRSYAVGEDQICLGWYRKGNWKSYGAGLSILKSHTGLHLLACPALNLDRNSILLISEHFSEKDRLITKSDPCQSLEKPGDLSSVTVAPELIWKLTLFAKQSPLPLPQIEIKEIKTTGSGTTQTCNISFSYSLAADSLNEGESGVSHYLSAILVNSTGGELLAYKKLKGIHDKGEGQVQVIFFGNCPSARLFVFVEEDHGYISFASELAEVKGAECERSEFYWTC